MKRWFSVTFKIVLLIILSAFLFFYWASSPTLSESAYEQVFDRDVITKLDGDSLYTIVTYNIGYLSGMTNNKAVEKPKELFDTNLKKVETELKKINPDIIAFQEIDYDASRSYHVNQEQEIANLGYPYIARAVNWDERYLPFPYWPPSMHFGKVVSGQSIVSKYPIQEHKRIVLDRVADAPFYRDPFYLDRLLQVVTVNLDGQEVVILNTHLEAFDKKTREQQMEEVVGVFLKYAGSKPTILVGDFNSDPNYESPAINQILTLPNVGNAAYAKSNIQNTFHTENPFERLDYIFFSKGSIQMMNSEVLASFGKASDHLPVAMTFKLL